MEIDGPNAARMTFRPLAEYQHGPIWPHPTANSQPAFYKRSKQFAPPSTVSPTGCATTTPPEPYPEPPPGTTDEPMNTRPAQPISTPRPASHRSTPPSSPTPPNSSTSSTGSTATTSPIDWPTTCIPPDATTPNPRRGQLQREPAHRPSQLQRPQPPASTAENRFSNHGPRVATSDGRSTPRGATWNGNANATSRVSSLANPTTREHRSLGVYEHSIDADWQCPQDVCNALEVNRFTLLGTYTCWCQRNRRPH